MDAHEGASAAPPAETRRRAQRPRARRVALGGVGVAALLSLAHTATDALTTMLAVLLPSIQDRTGAGPTVLALLVATLGVSTSMSQPFLGALSDRLDGRTVAAVGVVLSSVLLSLVGVVPDLAVLFALLLFGGLGSAALHPAGTVLARAAVARHGGLAVASFSAGGQLGYAIGPVAILAVVSAGGLASTPWLMVPGVLIGVALYVLLPAGEPRRLRVGPRSCLRCLARGPVAALAGAGVLADVAFVSFTSAIPLWLVRDAGLAPDAAVVGWTLAAFALGAVVGSVVTGALGNRVDRVLLSAGTMVAAVVPLIALLHLPVGSIAFFATVVTAGALAYANFPIMVITAQELAPHSLAAASGMLMGLATGTAGIVYIGVGRLQELLGFTTALTISALPLLPAAVITAAVVRRSGRPSSSDSETTSPAALLITERRTR